MELAIKCKSPVYANENHSEPSLMVETLMSILVTVSFGCSRAGFFANRVKFFT